MLSSENFLQRLVDQIFNLHKEWCLIEKATFVLKYLWGFLIQPEVLLRYDELKVALYHLKTPKSAFRFVSFHGVMRNIQVGEERHTNLQVVFVSPDVIYFILGLDCFDQGLQKPTEVGGFPFEKVQCSLPVWIFWWSLKHAVPVWGGRICRDPVLWRQGTSYQIQPIDDEVKVRHKSFPKAGNAKGQIG